MPTKNTHTDRSTVAMAFVAGLIIAIVGLGLASSLTASFLSLSNSEGTATSGSTTGSVLIDTNPEKPERKPKPARRSNENSRADRTNAVFINAN